MRFYAELWRVRARQIVLDLAVVIGAYLCVRAGRVVHRLVSALAAPGRHVEVAGEAVARNLDDVAGTVGDMPVVGGALQAPFSGAAGAGRALAEAGQTQQDAVLTLALWSGVGVTALGIGIILYLFLPSRVAWSVEATAASRLRDNAVDLRLFAYRAVANRSLRKLRRASPDPGGDLARGDYRALAQLELKELGLRAPG